MSEFLRALRMTLRYRLLLCGVAVSALLVAVCWGANIGTVYPLVEVVLHGQSLEEWSTKQLQVAGDRVQSTESKIQKLRCDRESAEAQQRITIDAQINFETSRLAIEQKALASAQRLQPWIKQWAPGTPFGTLLAVIGFLMAATLIRFVFIVANSQLRTRIVQRLIFDLRSDFFHHILHMDLAVVREYRTGTLITSATRELNLTASGLNTVLGQSLIEPLKILLCVTGAASISWRFLLLLVVVLPPAIISTLLVTKALRRACQRIAGEQAEVVNQLHQSITGIELIKAYNLEASQGQHLNQTAGRLLHNNVLLTLLQVLAKLNTEVLVITITGVALGMGGYLVLNQETHLWGIQLTDRPFSSGAIFVFFAFLIGIQGPFRKLSDTWTTLQSAAASAERFFAVMDRQASIQSPEQPQKMVAQPESLKFEQVSFRYSQDRPVLNSLDLEIRRGQTMAIVGSNGCGKSTLANLIPRFYDPDEGRISFGGVDIRQLSLHDLRSCLGVVTQTPTMFPGSVASNIRIGRPEASDAEVIEAACRAHAHEFIEGVLDDGYETSVGEQGNRLSGGQRQRIALARAILRDPKILILDEPTSAVDQKSERLIHQALREFTVGRITILISHHLPSLLLADSIAVMDEGRIIDVGKYDELCERCQQFSRLFGSRQNRHAG